MSNRHPLEQALGHQFKDPKVLLEALTHRGAVGARTPANERLEFLGDRVLGFIMADWLYSRYPDDAEGKLAHRLNGLVSREVCAEIGREIGVAAWIRLGRQAIDDGVFASDNVLGDVIEGLIGALWRDGGLDVATAFVHRHWHDRIEGQRQPPKHPKAALQELAAAKNRKPPSYAVTDRSGPDHRPRFTVRVSLGSLGEADGEGSSRQEAETAAAKALLEKLK